MKQLALALALAGTTVLASSIPAGALSIGETHISRAQATDAAIQARADMLDAFGPVDLAPGKYLWRDVPVDAGEERVVISLGDQMAYLYRGRELMAVTTISSGTDRNPTPTGIFRVHTKKPMHRSQKYENAPMPFAQFIDQYGIALHAGHLPGRPASHGCVRLPSQFAKKLYSVTDVGTPVLIGG
jgi:lipoprotein-anchoring transpeptidase ErfK/SrfK